MLEKLNFIHRHLFYNKVFIRLSFEKNRIWRFLPLRWIVKKKIGALPDKSYFEKKLSSTLGNFSYSKEILKKEKSTEDIIKEAETILNHKYSILGSPFFYMNPIDWHRDFKSSYTWNKNKFYLDYRKVDLTNSADVKFPWEMSRCHFLLLLGEAYLITGDEKYAQDVVTKIEHWINENPLMRSINWTCAMEVSIRAVNWLYAVNMIIDSEHVSGPFIQKLYISLFEHGFFISNNLEKNSPYSANHYVANIAGLLFIGKIFSHTKFGKNWYKFSLSEYYREMREQILPSGVHFEKSISYHRLVTELFGYSYTLLIRTEKTIPLDIHARMISMFKFIANYTKPNGLSPIIGDNDDGRFLPFLKHDFRDHRYLLGLANNIFDTSFFSDYKAFGSLDSSFLTSGIDKEHLKSFFLTTDTRCSNIYPDAGFAILKNERVYIFFSNSGLSRYPEKHQKRYVTHTHSDALSFELSIDGSDIIIDPGSHVYTSSKESRNEFRSTKKHNTVVVDGNNQSSFIDDNIFSTGRYEIPSPLKYSKNHEIQTVEGMYEWENAVEHRRKIDLGPSYVKVEDQLTSLNAHKYEFYYHFAKGVEIELIDDYISINVISEKLGARTIKLNISSTELYSVEVLDDTISPSYGKLEPAKTLKIATKKKVCNLKTTKYLTF